MSQTFTQTDDKEKAASFSEKDPDVVAIPVLFAESKDVYDGEDSGVDPVYYAKARLLNQAIQEIGMGRYQVGHYLIRAGYYSSRLSFCVSGISSASRALDGSREYLSHAAFAPQF